MLYVNQTMIEQLDEDNEDMYYEEIHVTNWNKMEKYLGKGWYEYAQKKKLGAGKFFDLPLGIL